MKVYQGENVIADIGNPYDLENWARVSGYAPETLSLDLSELKGFKESEVRNHASRWYEEHVRGFEGVVVVHKSATGAALSQNEGTVRASMQQNYQRVRDLITQVLAATDWRACRNITWTPPAGVQPVLKSSSSPTKRKRKHNPSLEKLAERVEALEDEAEERRDAFGGG